MADRRDEGHPPRPNMKPDELVDHLALLLTQRPLPLKDRLAVVAIAAKQRAAGPVAMARSALMHPI